MSQHCEVVFVERRADDKAVYKHRASGPWSEIVVDDNTARVIERARDAGRADALREIRKVLEL
jgi:hypothetical protein